MEDWHHHFHRATAMMRPIGTWWPLVSALTADRQLNFSWPSISWHALFYPLQQTRRGICVSNSTTIEMPRGPQTGPKGDGSRGGPGRWDGTGPRPARHIPWPEVCFAVPLQVQAG